MGKKKQTGHTLKDIAIECLGNDSDSSYTLLKRWSVAWKKLTKREIESMSNESIINVTEIYKKQHKIYDKISDEYLKTCNKRNPSHRLNEFVSCAKDHREVAALFTSQAKLNQDTKEEQEELEFLMTEEGAQAEKEYREKLRKFKDGS